MSNKEMTVSQKIAAFTAVGISEDVARTTIKDQNIRSLTKLTAAAAALVAAQAAVVAEKPAKVAKVKTPKVAGPKVSRPRGFRFGPVWLKSAAAGTGIVLKAKNLNKLVQTATQHGVTVDPAIAQAELAKLVSEKLSAN